MIHSRSTQDLLRINRDATATNVLSMLESVKEETLDSKIEDENDNSSYIEN